MSYRDKKKSRRENRIRKGEAFTGINEKSLISAEKGKARELRKSSWWKRKISYGICYYCGKKTNPRELTMDHKIPISRGGKSEKINLVPACKDCNNRKKYLLPVEWDEYLKTISKPDREGSEDGR